jgi:hypothetical protein
MGDHNLCDYAAKIVPQLVHNPVCCSFTKAAALEDDRDEKSCGARQMSRRSFTKLSVFHEFRERTTTCVQRSHYLEPRESSEIHQYQANISKSSSYLRVPTMRASLAAAYHPMLTMRASLAALLTTQALALYGVDLSTPVSESDAVCMKNAGVAFASARAWHSYGAFDDAVVGTSAAFAKAGIPFTVYLFPCAQQSAALQVRQLLGNLTAASVQYERVWFDIETNSSPGCGWSSNFSANCVFVAELVAAAAQLNVTAGMYASAHEWGLTAGAACTAGSELELWYPRYDNVTSFADFAPFGGFTAPSIKQYWDTHTLCGVGVDDNWRP